MSDRCTGHCCRAFTLPYSPDELVRLLWAWMHDVYEEHLSGYDIHYAHPVMCQPFDDNGKRMPRIGDAQELWKIVPMAVFLGSFRANPVTPQEGEHPASAREPAHYYTCRHFDTVTGDCRIYAARPAMCREYPYPARGGHCRYTDCAWAAARVPVAEVEPEVLTEDPEIVTEAEEAVAV